MPQEGRTGGYRIPAPGRRQSETCGTAATFALFWQVGCLVAGMDTCELERVIETSRLTPRAGRCGVGIRTCPLFVYAAVRCA